MDRGNGGCIFMSGSSTLIQHRCCSLNSSASNRGQHSFSEISNGNCSFVLESSISSCSKMDGYGCDTISCNLGINNISYKNFSYNVGLYDIAAYSINPNESPGKANFCSICHNDCGERIIGHFGFDFTPHFISNCNIINNSQHHKPAGGIIVCVGETIISNCSMFENNASGYLIRNSAKHLIMENCHFDNLTINSFGSSPEMINIDSVYSYINFTLTAFHSCLIPINQISKEKTLLNQINICFKYIHSIVDSK